MKHALTIAIAVALPLAWSFSAQAEADNSGFRVTLGPAVLYAPDWEGSEDYEVQPVPYVDIRYGDLFFASYIDGIGLNVLNTGGFTAGPVVKADFGRDEDDNGALTGLGDVDFGVELGGFVRYSPAPWMTAKLELRQAVTGHDGLVGEGSVMFNARLANGFFVSAGPSLVYADGTYMESYFGISSAQSAASGYPVFDAGGGLKHVAVNAFALYNATDAISFAAFGGYKRLLGDAEDSPLVSGPDGDADQFFGGAAITYSFGD